MTRERIQGLDAIYSRIHKAEYILSLYGPVIHATTDGPWIDAAREDLCSAQVALDVFRSSSGTIN